MLAEGKASSLSIVPVDWEVRTLSETTEILDHKRIPINAEERSKRQGDVPYYGANGLQGFIDRPLFEEPLILMAEDGGNFDDFATRPIAYRISGPSWVNNHAHIIRPAHDVDFGYLFFSLEHRDIRHYITGGTRSKLTQAELRSIEIPVPPLSEQRRIASILDSADEAIEKTQALISKLKQAKSGLMHDLLTRGIDERGHLRDPEANPEQFKDSPLGRIPGEWEAIELRDCLIALPQNGLYKPAHQIGSGTLMLGQTSITESRSINFDLTRRAIVATAEQDHFGLKEGDILVSRVFATVEGVGQPALVPRMPEPAVYESNMMRLQVDCGVISPDLLFSWLRLQRTRRYIARTCNASNQTSINQTSLNVLPVALPVPEEQQRITEVLDTHDERIRSEEAYRDKLKLQKKGLMEDFLTGRVRVNGGGEGNGA